MEEVKPPLSAQAMHERYEGQKVRASERLWLIEELKFKRKPWRVTLGAPDSQVGTGAPKCLVVIQSPLCLCSSHYEKIGFSRGDSALMGLGVAMSAGLINEIGDGLKRFGNYSRDTERHGVSGNEYRSGPTRIGFESAASPSSPTPA